MNKAFDKINNRLIKDFGKDRIMAMATSVDDTPTVRIIDTYYWNQSLYIVSHAGTMKVKELMRNKHVSLCTGLHEFQGEAINIGHLLKEENKELRELLIDAFSNWYFAHNDETDPKMCFVRVKLNHAFIHFNKNGYHVDFNTKEVIKEPLSK